MKKLMIVDDSEAKRRLLSIVLQGEFAIFEASSGAEALARVETIMPDVILLDIHMPMMDGFEVARCLEARPQTAAIPVLFTTVSQPDPVVEASWRCGGKDFIDWPLSAEALMAQINERLTQSPAEIKRFA